ncbi:hypothetical protein GCM10011494_22750 [Novosphingobium endophyticum]|uniref:Uncharacterized protein n=1 Tax=Novosphingobium endophyticum TaxID=1955250 RepID=A0A916X4X5_9SPHN|nr:hypothetical protein GCM10011494_22750 [Novosphingobium endophyticum]
MTQDAQAQRDKADHQCQCQAYLVYGGRKQRLTAQTQHADEEHAEKAMHRAKPAQENPRTVEPITNREKSAAHGICVM